jgi:hypothetical protein
VIRVLYLASSSGKLPKKKQRAHQQNPIFLRRIAVISGRFTPEIHSDLMMPDGDRSAGTVHDRRSGG